MALEQRKAKDDPTGDHDAEALDDAGRKMHTDKGEHRTEGPSDPEGNHDPSALEDRKSGVKP